jgi:hypothetical protein
MIKVVAYMFAFYTIALAGIPCQDKDVVSWQNRSQQQEVATSDASRTIPVDLCTPFCVCACCASVTLSTTCSMPGKISLSFSVATVSFPYQQPFSTGNSAGIWQPPKNLV